ncbi:DUF3885 domain-containing protein [Cellulomonas chitinilytica]|uniref:DUF3885 domain-containing protein n=1 Tax=Cellulomonas chitinilytica TaxID=398759 RepID=UPI0019452011|nr:hypothetical protein [Cellulomonas chitinilytica]
MPTADELTDAELAARFASVLSELAAETLRIEVHLGAAHDTYPAPLDEPPALAVIDDPSSVAALLEGLATADMTRRVVAQALPAIRIWFCDKDGEIGYVDLLSPSWVRGPWPYDGHLARPVLVDVLDRLGPTVWPRRTIEADLLEAPPAESLDARALATLWDARWPGVAPIAHGLPPRSDRWVRFHSLPGSKRYSDDEGEYEELLHRHHVVLDELASYEDAPEREVLVVTCSWSSTPTPAPRGAPITATLPDSRYWMSVLTSEPDEDDVGSWMHLFFDFLDRGDRRIERLLRLVADDIAAEVLIGDPSMRWLYHPYDGGADVYPATVELRDELRVRHRDWLSTHPSGY